MRWMIGLPLGACVISDEPRGLDKAQLMEMLADPEVRAAVIEALGETYVTPDVMTEYVKASDITDVVRTSDLDGYVQVEDVDDVVRVADLQAYATEDDLEAEVLARTTSTLPSDQEDCPAGAFVSGWDASGHATCATPLVEASCAVGVVVGFDADGQPVCTTALDVTVLTAEAVDVAALTVTDPILATGDLLQLQGALRVDAGAMPDRMLGGDQPETSGWVHHVAGNARRGTLVHGLPIAVGQPTSIGVQLTFDTNGATPPSMSDGEGQGIVLDVTYYAASGTQMEVMRCTFALLRSGISGVVETLGEACDDTLAGTGMDISVQAAPGAESGSGMQVMLTRSVTGTSGWQAWEIDYLSAFVHSDWTAYVGGEAPP